MPANSNDTRENIAELWWNIEKTESSDSWPELDAVGNTDGEGLLETFPSFLKGSTTEKRVDTKEVCIEDRRETCLLNSNLCQNRQKLGCEIEVVVKEPEPRRTN